MKKENIISKSINYRNFKEIDRSQFSSDIADLKIESDSIVTYVELYESEMKKIVDKHAPEIEKTLICRNPKPWYNANIKHLKRKMRKAERLWREHRNPRDHESFKTALKCYEAMNLNWKRNGNLARKYLNLKVILRNYTTL